MVASDGASMPAPLAIPPTVQLSGWCSATCLGTVSVVMIAWAASSPPVRPPAISCTICADAGEHLVHRQPVADQPGRADRDLDGAGLGPPLRQRGGDGLRGGVGVLEPARSGAGVGAAGVEDHRAQPPGGQHLLGPQHRRGLDLVAGEHPGGRVVGPFVEHQRQVASAPEALMPAAIPAARKPAGAVTPCVRTSRAGVSVRVTVPPRRPKGLRSPASPAPGSSTAPRRLPVPLTRLSIARDRHERAGVLVDRDGDVRGVAADHRAGAGQLPLGHQVNERLGVVGLFVGRPQLRQRRTGARGAGRQDAARRRDEHRGERHGDVAAGDRAAGPGRSRGCAGGRRRCCRPAPSR